MVSGVSTVFLFESNKLYYTTFFSVLYKCYEAAAFNINISFYLQQLLVILVLMIAVSYCLQIHPCPAVQLKPQKTLKHLRHHFIFVETPSTLPQSSLGITRRISRGVTVKIPGTTKCPWNWAQDDNPDRVPRFLTKAVCPNCVHYCRAVLYNHRGLVQKCDVRTGETVWKWSTVELPVAFVFDPQF